MTNFMIVFAGIAPHAPELLKDPKGNKGVIDALKKLQEKLSDAKPDRVVVISPHGTLLEKGFSVNLAQTYETDLTEALGVTLPKHTYKSDPLLTTEIKKRREATDEAPVMLVSTPKLDYGTALPLHFLFSDTAEPTIIPVNSSLHNLKSHYAFGDVLKEVIMSSPKRFAIIASVGLAHGKDEQKTDEKILAGLANETALQELANFDPAVHKKLDLCGLGALLMLGGIIHDLPWTFQQYAYGRTRSGTGMLVAECQLNI